MTNERSLSDRPGAIFVFCIVYGFHMVEEFSFGFVEWGDRYFGKFDWTQNLIGNFMFLVCLAAACYLYYRNPTRYLLAGMSASMWVLGNAFIHISANVLGGEYSPGVVTATVFYIPTGLYFLVKWGRQRLLTAKNMVFSFILGGMAFMLVPTFGRAVHYHAELARIFHLVS